jgi:NAD(P)-dependent dehydrogenase (short-subunit alcohol dehydrogenase family)
MMALHKTVLITGTSSGLGKAAAKHFAAKGWNVVATMHTPSAETELVGMDGVLVTRLDVQDPESIDRAIATGTQRFGRINVLVNNAGFGLFGLFEATPWEAGVHGAHEVAIPAEAVNAVGRAGGLAPGLYDKTGGGARPFRARFTGWSNA